MKVNIEYIIPPEKLAEIREEVATDLLASNEVNSMMWLNYEPEIRVLSEILSKNHDANTVVSWANEYKRLKVKHQNQEISMKVLMEERTYLSDQLKRHEIDYYEPTSNPENYGITGGTPE